MARVFLRFVDVLDILWASRWDAPMLTYKQSKL